MTKALFYLLLLLPLFVVGQQNRPEWSSTIEFRNGEYYTGNEKLFSLGGVNDLGSKSKDTVNPRQAKSKTYLAAKDSVFRAMWLVQEYASAKDSAGVYKITASPKFNADDTKTILYEGDNKATDRKVELSADATIHYNGENTECKIWLNYATVWYTVDGITWQLAPKGSEFTLTAKIK
jgi:hypothetical protein